MNANEAWNSLDLKDQSNLECARAWFEEGFAHGQEVKELTDEEIESWITEWAKDLYGTLYVEPTDHQRTMAIKMARAILRKAQEK
jgi:cob(I)alamin adenosyltransferase